MLQRIVKNEKTFQSLLNLLSGDEHADLMFLKAYLLYRDQTRTSFYFPVLENRFGGVQEEEEGWDEEKIKGEYRRVSRLFMKNDFVRDFISKHITQCIDLEKGQKRKRKVLMPLDFDRSILQSSR
eukprot:TRINITY_DN94_c0_g1_i1.p1 TRINITY_DN94_c0_g1~~TRINITY_DN94_c0_g1_i1.p1  ORF type:complete len:125 (-),score=27.36 TRINITY_DN94_c0_g1_i1:90-464(-)